MWNCHLKVSDDLQHKYPSLKRICFTRLNRQWRFQQVHPTPNYYCHVRRQPPGKKELQNKHALSDVPLWRIEGSQTHSDKNCAPNHSLYIHSIPKETAWFPLPPSLKVRKVCFKRGKLWTCMCSDCMEGVVGERGSGVFSGLVFLETDHSNVILGFRNMQCQLSLK